MIYPLRQIFFTALLPLTAMVRRFFCLGFLILLGVALGGQSTRAESRVALVIGNGAYRNEPHLPNPPNDANDVAAALRRDGFDTILAIDLDKAAMDEAMIRFARAARDADVAMFYYSGHALQFAGVNYLAPIDFQLNDEADLRRMVRVDDIVSDLQQARNLRILVLDSCRDNPLADQLKRSIGSKRSLPLGRGLARIDSPQGMIVAYSTQAGTTADDGEGRNSPYTAAFLKNIEAQEEIGTIFRRISSDVYETTKHEQLPELSLSLIGEFYLRGKLQLNIKPDAPAVVVDTTKEDFAAAERVDTPGGWDAFLAQHPSGFYAALAKERRAKVASATAVQSGPDPKLSAEPRIAALSGAVGTPSESAGVASPSVDVAAVRRKYNGWALRPTDIHGVRAVAVSPEGLIASGSDDGSVKMWDAATGSLLRTLSGHTGPVSSLVFLANRRKLLAGSNDKTVEMWDVADGKLRRTFSGSTRDGTVSSLSSSGNGLYAVSSSPKERSFTVWDAQIGTPVVNQQNFDNPISAVAMGPDGHFIAAAGISGVITFWDWTGGASLRDLKAHSAKVNAVSITSDGRHLVSASEDRSVKIWDLPSGKFVRTLLGHTDSVKTVTISSDGRKIASAGADNAIIVWDLASGARLQTLTAKSGEVMGVAFSPDGHRVISGASDGAIRIWDATSGALLASYLDLGQETGAVVRDDGSFWTDPSGFAKLRLVKGSEVLPLPDDYVAAFLRQSPAGQNPIAAVK